MKSLWSCVFATNVVRLDDAKAEIEKARKDGYEEGYVEGKKQWSDASRADEREKILMAMRNSKSLIEAIVKVESRGAENKAGKIKKLTGSEDNYRDKINELIDAVNGGRE